MTEDDKRLNEIKQKPPHRRPYWHVDLKWIFGLMALVVLWVWLLLLSAYQATAPSTGVPLTTNLLAYSFSRNGLDDGADINKLKAKLAQTHLKSIQPIPGFPVTITAQQLNTLSPRDLRLNIFNQIASPLYYSGAHAYAQKITSDPAKQKKFENDATLLNLVTQAHHNALGKLDVMVGVAAAILLAAAIFFSAGFGRLVTPAIILLIASLPGTTLFSSLRAWSENPTSTASGQAQDVGAIIDATKGFLTTGLTSIQNVYLYTLLAALVLLAVALVGKIGTVLIRKKQKPETHTS